MTRVSRLHKQLLQNGEQIGGCFSRARLRLAGYILASKH
jgi:hypothetical protein